MKTIEIFPGPVACDCSGIGTPRDQEKQSRLSRIIQALETDYAGRVKLVQHNIFDDAQYAEALMLLGGYLRAKGEDDLADRVAFSVRQVTPAIAVDGELLYVGNAPELHDFLAELDMPEPGERA